MSCRFAWASYLHCHELIYLYVHSTDTSVQLHNHTSLSIRPDQRCYAGQSQLRSGSTCSEQPPSCHQSSQLTDHPGAAGQLAMSKLLQPLVYLIHIAATQAIPCCSVTGLTGAHRKA
jgi:hypothetical protein